MCTINAIPQADLEGSVIEAMLDFYKPYLAGNGRRSITQAIKPQLGSVREDFAEARGRAEKSMDLVPRQRSAAG